MKKLSWFNKIVFVGNIALAVATLLGYLLPFLAPKLFPILSVFTLILPSLLTANLVFLFYCGIQINPQAFLSLLILLIGVTFINKFYKINGKLTESHEDDILLMTYNVRLFNLFKWIPDDNVTQKIQEFIELQNPDILCLQEFSKNSGINLKQYPYKHIITHGDRIMTGQAIYSKFRMIDKGEIKLPNSNNNVIFADIVIKKDTIRVYSIHLQSISISPDIHEKIDEQKSKMIFKRISRAFKEQQLQSELIQSHMKDASFRKIICGDMNNSAFSYVYSNIKNNLNDAFIEAGSGFGKTYHFPYYPMRIDYVFTDPTIEVKSFETYSDFVNSDHYPIVTRLNLNRDNN